MSSAVASSSSSTLSKDAIAATHNVHFALSPRIGVLSSPDVHTLLEANHLATFPDLLRPFEDSIEHLTVRTSQLETRRCDTFPLSFDDLDVFAPQSASASTSTLFTPADIVSNDINGIASEKLSSSSNGRQSVPRYSRPELLLDEISARVSAKSKAVWEKRSQSSSSSKRHSRKLSSLGGNADSLKVFLTAEDEQNLERFRRTPIESLTPWFADTKSMVLNTRNVSEHETFGHPLAIMLVVSTNSPDPMNAFAALFEASEANTCRAFILRPFVDPHILRYYVLLHDISTCGADLSESIALLDNIKKTYGLHCCLLPINSQADTTPDQEASFRIAKLYSHALRHERLSARSREVTEIPPALPTKNGHPVEAPPELSRMTTSEDESLRWNASKDEHVEYGANLTEEDIKKIRSFVRDFAAQSLIPFLERCVSLWNEQLTASRKGLTGRLFGAASRKFFSGASVRGVTQSQPAASFSTLGYYPHSTMEAQTRRLADFAFMTRDYKLAAAMYDLGRRDYANDKATKYIAGANEMFGLSHLMIMLCTHSPPIDVDSYLASAGQNYLVSPRQKGSALQLNSLRATLLYYEAYRGLHYYRSAPYALVRTATEGSGEAENDLEVAGAMLLEQAAISDLRQSDGPALRKCALHLVMAAHRYRSCGQKHLSLRCFQGAASFYLMLRKNRSYAKTQTNDDDGRERIEEFITAHEKSNVAQWDLIEDHLEQELGQQASSEGQVSQAVLHFFALLRRQRLSIFNSLEESSQKHQACLEEFLNCCKYLETDFKSLLQTHEQEASLPLVDKDKTYIIFNTKERLDEEPWLELEQQLQAVAGRQNIQASKQMNTATVKEAFSVSLVLVNPLNTPLKVTSLTIDVQDDSGGALSSELARVDMIEEIAFDPLEEKKISITVMIKEPCKVRLSSVSYLLAGQVSFQESLILKGKRLNDTKEQRASLQPIYAINESLSVVIEKEKPKLEAKVLDMPSRLGLGEEVEADIIIENRGVVPLRNARAIINRPDMILLRDTSFANLSKGEITVENDLKSSRILPVDLPDNALEGGAIVKWPVLLRANALGLLTLRLIFVYESEEGEMHTSQLQHSIHVDSVIDLAAQVEPSRSEDLEYHLKVDAISLVDSELEESVSIEAISFLSPAWRIALSGDGDKKILEPFIDMPHMQAKSTSMNLSNDPSSAPIREINYTVRQLQSLLTGRSLDRDISPDATSINVSQIGQESAQISPFFLLARREYRTSLLTEQFSSSISSIQDLQRIFLLYEPNEVDVIAYWQMNKSKRRGQAFVFGLKVGPLHDYFESLFLKNQDKYTRSLYAEVEKEKAALWADVTRNRLHMEDDPILFDFVVPALQQQQKLPSNGDVAGGSGGGTIFATKLKDSNRSIFIVELLVRNLSTQRTRDVVLQLDNTLSPASTTLLQLHSAVQASYINRLTYRATMAPQSLIRFQAKASITQIGNVILAPVLVKSTVTGAEIGQERPFQRWEHCSGPMKVLQSS